MIDTFIRLYEAADREKIAVAWPSEVVTDARDANRGFRTRVIDKVLASETDVPPTLLRDLFIEEAKWSELSETVSPAFPKLAERLLVRTRTAYLTEFLEGSIASFSTYGACHLMNLDQELILTLLNETQRRLRDVADDKLRGSLNLGESLFTKLRNGTAQDGWYVKDGPPGAKRAGFLEQIWVRLTGSIWRKLRRKGR